MTKPDARDPNYPRMMFHRTLDPVTVRSEGEELALGAEWSRKIWPAVEDAREHNAKIFAHVAAAEIAALPPPAPPQPPAPKAKAKAKAKPKKKKPAHAVSKNLPQHKDPLESGGSV